MDIIDNISDLHQLLFYQQEKVVGLIPTMGHLHAGHLSLITAAKQAGADFIIVSIFVNPLQFDNKQDLKKYPRSLNADCELLTSLPVDCVFTPSSRELYPHGFDKHCQIQVPFITEALCGNKRPGHFNGVATIIAKLFNITQADMAVFGEKDYQQIQVIKKLIADFDIPLEIITAPTVREADGLAMSSRNARLTPEQRQQAPCLFQTLSALAAKIQAGDRAFSDLQRYAEKQLQANGFDVDYVQVVHPETLQPAKTKQDHYLIAAAAYLDNVRLIDNICLSV